MVVVVGRSSLVVIVIVGRFAIPRRRVVGRAHSVATTESRLAAEIAETSTGTEHAVDSVRVLVQVLLGLLVLRRSSIAAEKWHVTRAGSR